MFNEVQEPIGSPRISGEVHLIMARTHRPHQPGAAFHIVARTQGHAPLFLPTLKRHIDRFITEGVSSAGARLIAHVVMDNHIHVVLFQPTARLGWIMQPILRRTALMIQRHHGVEGHVFERRFRAKQCESTEHLRNCILYVHRNPVEARLVRVASAYEFSSARAYEGLTPCGNISVLEGLQLFGCSADSPVADLRRHYVSHLAREFDADMRNRLEFWLRRSFRRSERRTITRWQDHEQAPLTDLRDAALCLLKVIDDDADVDVVRSRYGGPQIVAVRVQLIASLIQRGYSGRSIAEYLRVSDATISRVRSQMRYAALMGREDSGSDQH